MYFYSILVSIKVIELAKEVKIVVVTDILTGVLPAVVAKMLGIKIIYSEGNLTPWVTPYIFPKQLSLFQKTFYLFEKINGKIITKLSEVVRVQGSSIRAGMIKHGVKPNKIIVIGPGIDVNMFKSHRISHQKLKIGFIGRLSDEKGAPLLLKICRMLENTFPEIMFKIFGEGPYKKHFQHLKNIEFIGWINRSDIYASLSDVNVLLFFQRDLGIGELEALSMGKIIIAPNISSIPQIIKNGENGFLTNPDAESFIDTIKNVLSLDAYALQRISKKARKTISTSFSWEVVGEKWKSVIKHILESGNKKML
ncbi:MAG: glycosyltransferase family 4 protein [Candidatus Aenigmatarchaeota archaeon]